MCNHTAVAKTFVVAACTLAVALLTIGIGVNSSWAGSDQLIGLNFTPTSLAHNLARVDRPFSRVDRTQYADDCVVSGRDPGGGACFKCCSKTCLSGTNNVCK